MCLCRYVGTILIMSTFWKQEHQKWNFMQRWKCINNEISSTVDFLTQRNVRVWVGNWLPKWIFKLQQLGTANRKRWVAVCMVIHLEESYFWRTCAYGVEYPSQEVASVYEFLYLSKQLVLIIFILLPCNFINVFQIPTYCTIHLLDKNTR